MWYLRHLVELKRIMLRNSFTVSSYSVKILDPFQVYINGKAMILPGNPRVPIG